MIVPIGELRRAAELATNRNNGDALTQRINASLRP